ncbi:MAG: hypothetical protein Q8N63_01995 [Nanoarchaeota archaeon]|nr:hypothetical protein [Nanoarchaeota archaeon]
MTKIDLTAALNGKPRPHFLVGEAEYSFENGAHRIIATAVFPSSRDSVGDRAEASIPHANIGDAYFGLWNAVHIICEKAGVYGTLTSEGRFNASRPLPPDTPIRLEVILNNIHNSGRHIYSDYRGVYSLGNRKLLELSGKGVGIKRKTSPSNFFACYGMQE